PSSSPRPMCAKSGASKECSPSSRRSTMSSPWVRPRGRDERGDTVPTRLAPDLRPAHADLAAEDAGVDARTANDMRARGDVTLWADDCAGAADLTQPTVEDLHREPPEVLQVTGRRRPPADPTSAPRSAQRPLPPLQ